MNRHRMQRSYSMLMIILSYHQTNNLIQRCTVHPMLRTSAEIICEAALLLNDKEKIKEICNFRFLLKKSSHTY